MSTSIHRALRGKAALLGILVLTGCTTPGGWGGHARHHPDRTAAMAGGPSGQPMPGQADMAAMCAMQRDMQKMSPEQHRAMMEEKMKGMTPAMRQRHREMMQRHCR